MDFTIVYFATVGQNYGGVEQKIIGQFDALVKHTSNVFLYLISSYSPKGKLADEINKRPSVKVLVNKASIVKNPLFRRKGKFQLISNALKDHNPLNTIVYLRYPNSDFIFLDFLNTCSEYKIVTEHNEIENKLRNYKFSSKYIEKILENIYGKRVRKKIFGFVGVTREITDFEIRESDEFSKPAITIGNGIDINIYPMRKLKSEYPEIIKLLFVGAGFRSHGLDRIIKGMNTYIKAPERQYKIILRISGESDQMDENRSLVKKLKMNDYVEFLGFKNSDELNVHFEWADIGVGCLGLHRFGLKYTTALKEREYFSRGIPFFSSTIDEDLLGCAEYVLRVDATDASIKVEDIIKFALRMRNDVRHPEKIRRYAIDNLDWSIKMKSLLTFFESLYKSSTESVSAS